MRNKRLIIALTGAVLCGLLGVTLITRYLSSVQAFTKDLGNVVVAKQEIPLGEKITAEHLALAPIPNGSAPEGLFRSMDQVVGRVAITPIGVRETITTLKLAPAGVGAGLSAVIPEGYRAMTVKVDDVVGVSGFIMPGSFVDVVAIIVPISQQGVDGKGPDLQNRAAKHQGARQRGEDRLPRKPAPTIGREGRDSSGDARAGRKAGARYQRGQAATRYAQLQRPGRYPNRRRQQSHSPER